MVVYDLEYFATHYGIWAGLLIYIFIRDILPLLKKLVPAQIKAALAEKEAKAAELMDERQFRHKMDLERLVELKEIARSTQVMATNLAQTNANIATIMTNQQQIIGTQRSIEDKMDYHHNTVIQKMDDHQEFMAGGMSDMREEVARRRGKEEAND